VTAPASTPAAPAATGARERQPVGLFLLFGVEMWERFSYYGMRALLVLFLVDHQRGGFGWDKASAQKLYGLYGFSAYLLPVFGGWLADRIIGTHRSMVIGSVIIMAGHLCLAASGASHAFFFLGLVLIVLGTGFFKSNVSTMVGQLYREDDPRRDGGYTIFYMGVNTGALIGPLICGWLAENPRYGWHWGFGAAAVGMALGLAMYLLFKQRYLPGIGLAPTRAGAPVEAKRTEALTHDERRHVAALLVLFVFVILFWMAFEQTGSSMNLFAQERTNRATPFGVVPASWFQSVNPIFIILFAPVFTAVWSALERRGRDLSTPAKMALGLALMGGGFVFLVGGALGSEGGARSSMGWLVGAYLLHTWGELCLSPIGLSLVSRMAPRGRVSVFMGLWFVATSISELLAGFLAAATEKFERGEVFHLFGGQADFFFLFVVTSAIAAVALLALTPWLRRLMAR
jgi:POT family proton-dependent oligopeptide transporter